jgi:hypothetical protein
MNWNEFHSKHPWTGEGWHQHPNGGGWIYESAVVSNDVSIGELVLIKNGKFLGGEFIDGEFFGGTFLGGKFCGGVYYGGKFHGGAFFKGVFSGGVYHAGEFRYAGKFSEGVWRRSPICINDECTRYPVIEIGPEMFSIGCERGLIFDADELLPMWFRIHNTPLNMQDCYVRAVRLLLEKINEVGPILKE